MKFLPLILLAGMIYLSACNDNAPVTGTEKKDTVPAFDISAVKAAVMEANKAFTDAAVKGDSMTIAATYAAGAHLLAPNAAPAENQAGIQAMAASLAKAGLKEFKLETVDVFGGPEYVIEEGKYTMGDGKGKTLDEGKYLTVWKQENGKWKLYRDMYSSNLPVPSPRKK